MGSSDAAPHPSTGDSNLIAAVDTSNGVAHNGGHPVLLGADLHPFNAAAPVAQRPISAGRPARELSPKAPPPLSALVPMDCVTDPGAFAIATVRSRVWTSRTEPRQGLPPSVSSLKLTFLGPRLHE
jgi:hypothetical protein